MLQNLFSKSSVLLQNQCSTIRFSNSVCMSFFSKCMLQKFPDDPTERRATCHWSANSQHHNSHDFRKHHFISFHVKPPQTHQILSTQGGLHFLTKNIDHKPYFHGALAVLVIQAQKSLQYDPKQWLQIFNF